MEEITVYISLSMFPSQSEVTWSTIKLTAHSPPGIGMQALKLSKSDGEYFHLLSFSLPQTISFMNIQIHNHHIIYVVISFGQVQRADPGAGIQTTCFKSQGKVILPNGKQLTE